MMITVSKNELGFMPGRSTMEAIYLLRRLLDKYRKKKDLHMVFIDLEKASDKGHRDSHMAGLEDRLTKVYIQVVKDMMKFLSLLLDP